MPVDLPRIGLLGVGPHDDLPVKDAAGPPVEDPLVKLAVGAVGERMVDQRVVVDVLRAAREEQTVEGTARPLAQDDVEVVADEGSAEQTRGQCHRARPGEPRLDGRDVERDLGLVLELVVLEDGPLPRDDLRDGVGERGAGSPRAMGIGPADWAMRAASLSGSRTVRRSRRGPGIARSRRPIGSAGVIQAGPCAAGPPVAFDDGRLAAPAEDQKVQRGGQNGLAAGPTGARGDVHDQDRVLDRDPVGDEQERAVLEEGRVQGDERIALERGVAAEVLLDEGPARGEGLGEPSELHPARQHPVADSVGANRPFTKTRRWDASRP